MKRTQSILMILIAAVGLMLSACTVVPDKEPSPQKIITLALSATKNLKSAGMDYSIDMMLSGTKMQFTGTGVVKNPGQAYIKMNFGGQPFEMLMVAKNRLYVRTDPNASWSPMKSSTTTQVGMTPDLFSQELQLISLSQNPILIGSETIHNVDCWHIAYAIDAGKAEGILAGPIMDQASSVQANGELWIGQHDFVIYQNTLKMKGKVNEDVNDLNISMTLRDINQAVTIPTP